MNRDQSGRELVQFFVLMIFVHKNSLAKCCQNNETRVWSANPCVYLHSTQYINVTNVTMLLTSLMKPLPDILTLSASQTRTVTPILLEYATTSTCWLLAIVISSSNAADIPPLWWRYPAQANGPHRRCIDTVFFRTLGCSFLAQKVSLM